MEPADPATLRVIVEDDSLAPVADEQLGVGVRRVQVVGGEERPQSVAQAHARRIDRDPRVMTVRVDDLANPPAADRFVREVEAAALEGPLLERREELTANAGEERLDRARVQ